MSWCASRRDQCVVQYHIGFGPMRSLCRLGPNSCPFCLRRDKCDPTAIWKLADRYLSSFNDISMLMYQEEFQRRLDPFLS